MNGNKIIRLSLLVSLISSALNSSAKEVCAKNVAEKPAFSIWLSKSQQNNPNEFLKGFFKWYRSMFDYLDHHIKYVFTYYKNNTPYRVNFHETERYLSILKSSGFFSDIYITNRRDYFKQVDLKLQQTKQSDGIVDAVSYDFMTHATDPKPLFDYLDKISFSVVNTTPFSATIKVQTPFNADSYLLYYLKKTNDKFVIDKIDFLIGGVMQK